MNRLPLHTVETAAEASRSYLKTALANNGFLPNLVASLANSPAALEAYLTLGQINGRSGLTLAEREVIQITAAAAHGCAFCVDYGVKHAKQDGETDERLHGVAAWREMPHYSDAERAALALAEAMTHIDERDPVPDPVWNDAAKHFDERQLAGLVLWIATTNLFNRANVATRQPPGQAF